ncbi:MAG: serine hydrolase [Thermomicrobiales bacterium]
MRPHPMTSSRITRRQLLAAATVTAAAAARPAWPTAAQTPPTPVATPAATPAATPVAIAAPLAPMPSTLAADASPQMQAVADALVAGMQQVHVPGAAVGVLWGDREEHATFGVESLSSLRPVTEQTLFQIGSVTKTYTSTAIWHLIDRGALNLDDPVRTWLPELTLADEEVAAAITIGNLLDHSGGFFGDDTWDSGFNDDMLARYVTERLPALPQEFPLGAFFSYNNVGFTILGRLIEVVTGTAYSAAMGNLLFGPLGLGDTLLEREAVLRRLYADGHITMPINGEVVTTVQLPLWVVGSAVPAGAIWATTRDVIRYARFHMAHGDVSTPASVVSPASLRAMQEPALPISGTDMWIGRDWFVQDIEGIRVISHSGDTLGQHTDLFIVPDHDFAIVVTTNGQPGSHASFAAVEAAVGQVPALAPLVGKLGLVPQLSIPPDAAPITLTAEELDAYTGRYESPSTRLTITRQDDQLAFTAVAITQPDVWHPAIPFPASPPGDLAFIAPDIASVGPGKIPFMRNADGDIGWVSLGLRLIPRVGEA